MLGLGALLYVQRFFRAWSDLRAASFGLERDNAQGSLNQAAAVLVLLLILGVAEFVVVDLVTPAIPSASPLPTPTLDLLATPTITLEAGEAMEEEAMGGESGTPTPLPTIALADSGCVAGEVWISSPQPDEVITGEVEITGVANSASFSFYKVEIARKNEPLWLTIQAGRDRVEDGVLVPLFDTTRLPIDDYVLQLVVVDLAGETLPPCRIPVRIEAQ